MSGTNSMPFAGKWTFTAGGLVITLKNPATGEMDLQASQGTSDTQQLNSYGDPATKIWLQAGNWKYLTYSAPGYFASALRSETPAEFLLEAVSGDKYRIVQKTGSGDFYLSANGAKLERIPKAGSPPDSTIFLRNVVTPGLPQLRFGAMGRNLRGVDFTGDDLTDFTFNGSDLSFAVMKAILKLTTFQGCTIAGTDFTSVDLKDVVMGGIRGEKPIFDDVLLHESTDMAFANIPKASFLNARSTATTVGTGPTLNGMKAEGANFNGANLTAAVCNGCNFQDSQWINAKLHNAQAGSTRFDRASMERIDCTGAALQGSFFDGGQLVNGEFSGADITACSFKGANLTNARLSKVLGLTGIHLEGAQMIAAILTGLDLTSASLDKDTVFLAAQMEGVNLTGHALDGVNFVRANMKSTKLDKTSMERAVLVGAVLSLASATGNVSFVGADLSNSQMEGANLNGAQMGAKQALGTLSAAVIPSLNRGELPSGLNAFLSAKGFRTSAAVKVTVHEPDEYWVAEHEGVEFRLEHHAGAVRIDQVGAVPAAVLSNAYMPNADLTGANLYAVDMSGVHWYGSRARADNANLEQINFSNANLSSMNFSQARMYGANLSFAVVVESNFTAAKLTPTSQLRATSFAFASMQGANFTAAQIGRSNLTNAAVSLDLAAPKRFVGVPLFPLEITFKGTLDKKRITEELREQFSDNGYPLIDEATVTVDELGVQWTISNFVSGSTTLQSGYSNFVLWKRPGIASEEIGVFGGSPVLVIRKAANNEQEQGLIAFGGTKELRAAMDQDTTTPSGMKLSMEQKNVTFEELMTGGLPPRPPKCIPTPDHWC